MHDACAGSHAVFTFSCGFISKVALRELLGEVGLGYVNAVCASLCEMPGVNGTLHCHCSDFYSLQCMARRVVVRLTCENFTLYKTLRTPYFFCCSRFVVFRFSTMLYVKIRNRYVNQAQGLMHEMGLEWRRYGLRHGLMTVLETRCPHYVMSVLTTLLHQTVNLNPDDPGGYHFGTWEGWRDGATNMFGGVYCNIRFIDMHGESIQERLLVRGAREMSLSSSASFSAGGSLQERAVRVMEMPPPRRLPNGRWRCFFAPAYCCCTAPCDCPDDYQSADLTPYFVERYSRDMCRTPHALKMYVQFYAALML